MKNFPLIIGFCLGIALLLVTSAILFQGYQRTKAMERQIMLQRQKIQNGSDTKTPDQQTSSMSGNSSPSAQTDVNSLLNDVSQAKDDEGQRDLQALKDTASGL